MTRIIRFTRSLLGLDDFLVEPSATNSGKAHNLRVKVGVGAAVVCGLGLLCVVISISIVSGTSGTTEVPREILPQASQQLNEPVQNPLSASQDGDALVHVVGAVKFPGIYKISAGQRVVDVVMAAGGFTAEAQLCAVNMARTITDGEQLKIPAGPQNQCDVNVSGSSKKISLNAASVAELDSIAGIGPTLAQRIVDWRMSHGSFTTIAQLNEISGISDKLFASIKDQLAL